MSQTTETESAGRILAADRAEHPSLTVVHHPDRELIGVTQVVTSGDHVVGRDGGSLLPGVFEHRRVSREHAGFRLRKGKLAARDLDSRNGTHVNGAPITETELQVGDVVRVGEAVLLFHTCPRHFEEPNHPLMAGISHTLAALLSELEDAGTAGGSVMLLGETGVGKELAARIVHESSGRAGKLVPVNCGGVAEGVIQSELFGHTRGAFSGADAGRLGLVDEARGGTLFLDEIAAAPGILQSTLLRLLENEEYRVVGANKLRRADVRFVAATHPEVEDRILEGAFRRDLWYRLAHRIVRIPPLRDRREDIPAIIAHHCERQGRPAVRLSPKLATLLIRHDWPGNVRELLATVDQLTASMTENEELDVPDWLRRELVRPRQEPRLATGPKKRPDKQQLLEVLREHGGSVSHAAKALDVDRKSLYRWLSAHEIDLDALRSELS